MTKSSATIVSYSRLVFKRVRTLQIIIFPRYIAPSHKTHRADIGQTKKLLKLSHRCHGLLTKITRYGDFGNFRNRSSNQIKIGLQIGYILISHTKA